MPSDITVRSFAQPDALHAALADLLSEVIATPSPVNEPYALMLSGGSTPLPAYNLVAERHPPVSHAAYFMLSDERMVAPDSHQSNFSEISPLFNALELPRHRLLLVDSEAEPSQAATGLHGEIGTFLDQRGRLALGLLGVGSDGHTASLFTQNDLDRGEGHYAVDVERPDGLGGVSVTPDLLKRVERLVFVVSGASKQGIVKTLLEDPFSLIAGQATLGHPSLELWADVSAL